MVNVKKNLKRGLGLFALGYGLGILTAPKSGKATRRSIKRATKRSVKDIEKELKGVYSQTKATLDKFAKDNPNLTTKLKAVSAQAQKSQAKVKELLSAVHGSGEVDEDLTSALQDAKTSLEELKKYLKK